MAPGGWRSEAEFGRKSGHLEAEFYKEKRGDDIFVFFLRLLVGDDANCAPRLECHHLAGLPLCGAVSPCSSARGSRTSGEQVINASHCAPRKLGPPRATPRRRPCSSICAWKRAQSVCNCARAPAVMQASSSAGCSANKKSGHKLDVRLGAGDELASWPLGRRRPGVSLVGERTSGADSAWLAGWLAGWLVGARKFALRAGPNGNKSGQI